jgi:hypothetical protein
MLATSGTYTVIVSDCNSTNTGGYVLYSQRTNNPSGASSLTFGQIATGMIVSAAQSNTYTFAANANDKADFTLVATSGALGPEIIVYNPSGTLNSSNYTGSPGSCSGSRLELNEITLPTTGTYTVLVKDCVDTNTGSYDLYTQKTDSPAGPSNLPFGQVLTGSISSATQSNTYTFSGNTSDEIDFTPCRHKRCSRSVHPSLQPRGDADWLKLHRISWLL